MAKSYSDDTDTEDDENYEPTHSDEEEDDIYLSDGSTSDREVEETNGSILNKTFEKVENKFPQY